MPFLDKAFLEVAMNIDPKDKMFSKGSQQEVDEDGCPKMEKVRWSLKHAYIRDSHSLFSTSSGKPSTVHQMARYVLQ